MIYPGNSALSTAVKDRVVTTFHQTLALYKQGRRDEVAAGCNLILQMDPLFDPARKLLDKTRNPDLPIDVDMLLPLTGGRAPIDQARDAMAARDFQRVIHLTTEILTDDLMNEDARVLGDEARERIEAAPFIDQFVRKCDQSLAAGNVAAAKADVEKARSLDPTHPDVVRITQAIAAREAQPRPTVPSSSFVVDDSTQQATGRAATQASDFGFTFEEDKQPEQSFSNFSFDAPADSPFGGFSFGAPAAPPAATPPAQPGEFDFSTAAVSTSPDDQKKIEQYLVDGDRAAAAGDYQQAIDLWSRIFLIDVTNDQASDRIEKAKAKRREVEQKVETLILSGQTALERGDRARARADFAEAARLDPNNTTAQEWVARLADTVTEGGAAAAEEPYVAPPMDDKIDLGFFEDEPMAETSGASLVPPAPKGAPGSAAAKKATQVPKATPKPARKLPVMPIVAVLGVLLLGAGGWFVWSRFMNKPVADPAATEAVLARATMLAGRGKIDEAIALLQEIKPTDPQHDRAIGMIADLQQKKNKSAQMIDGKPAAQYYDEQLAAGRLAFEAHDYAGAKAAYENARNVKPLPPDAKAQFDAAADQVAKLDAAKALFTEQKYDEAISNLQPLLEQDPQNANVRRLIVDAHFNLGAKALQEERTNDAIREFDEVLKVNPQDELARRSRELALRYDKSSKDLLYRIYVKYLPLRQAA